ncbi:aminotransferase class I/II-fold pyridoxal phosphate-dependent enzyme [Azospirillum sp. SYSU D00513]|uniref:aminotransferase class I/II-fold pyridoxal phosphate-dependent enzyme n=1 Tax=Azospirillum sp. SYSU D00513 TaxID=2812561 RepID=UPI001A967F6D|nr:aminotransferase class I/II-fold pyridoxal phosphate-dependent enzyme [Azospirillum sp. SYSU D00513]
MTEDPVRAAEELLAEARASAPAHPRRFLNLYAGANLPSAAVSGAYAPELSAYPAMGPSFRKEQPGTELVSRLEVAVRGLARRLFAAGWAEPRLPSCTLANLAVFHAFSRPGDLLLGPAAEHGGHLSQRQGGTPDLAGLRCETLPFDRESCTLDGPAAARMVRERRPRIVLLGRSIMLKPDDIRPVVEAAREAGALTMFDAAHVAGLIAGGSFPNPLEQGVDVMTMSTYKTLPGHPQGLAVGRDPAQGERLAELLDRRFLANYNAGRLPALLAMLLDVAKHGVTYARRVSDCSSALAASLRALGLPVLAPESGTLTHQILLPITDGIEPGEILAHLERCGIVTGSCANPGASTRNALRIGTQLVAHFGAEPEDMDGIATLLRDALAARDGADTAQAALHERACALAEMLFARRSP